MILALLLQVAIPTQTDEVTVIGQKLKMWRASCQTKGAAFTCRTKRSSGDRDVDAIGDAAMAACFPAMRSRLDASQAKAVYPARRKAILAAVNEDYGRCMVKRRDALISALADKRAAARLAQ